LYPKIELTISKQSRAKLSENVVLNFQIELTQTYIQRS